MPVPGLFPPLFDEAFSIRSLGNICNGVVCETSFSVSLRERKIFEKRFPYYLAPDDLPLGMSFLRGSESKLEIKTISPKAVECKRQSTFMISSQYQNIYYQGEPLPYTHYIHTPPPLAISRWVGGATRVRPGDRFSSMY